MKNLSFMSAKSSQSEHLGGSARMLFRALGGKKIILILLLTFFSASCSLFTKPLPVGLVKTLNGGTDWQFVNTVKGSTTLSMSGLNISKLDFDPQDRQTVFAGAYNGGLYKSDDAGSSWTDIFPNKINVYDFAIHPGNSKLIYAVGLYDNAGRVAKTTDGGASWNEIYHEASVGNTVRSITLNPTNANQMLIGTAAGTVIKSSDDGSTWQLLKDFKTQVNRVLWQNNTIYVLLKTKGLEESTDGGNTFNDASGGLVSNSALLNYSQNSVSNFSQMYVDYLNPNLIYLTTDKGLYKSVDNGKTFTKMNLPVQSDQTATHAIAIAREDSNTIFTSVNSTVYKSQDAGQTWQTQGINGAGGFINYLLIDPQLPQIVYGGIYSNQ